LIERELQMKIKDLKTLHSKVIHSELEVTEVELDAEELWVGRYPYDVLETVCSDCFASPEAQTSDHALMDLHQSN
jgi:hypothetical protein